MQGTTTPSLHRPLLENGLENAMGIVFWCVRKSSMFLVFVMLSMADLRFIGDAHVRFEEYD